LPDPIDTFTYNIAGGNKFLKIKSGFRFFPNCDYEIDWISFDITRENRWWYAVNASMTELDHEGEILDMQIQMNIIDMNVEPNTIEHGHSNVEFARLYNWTLALVHF
jgi:hypothetical protein